MHPVCDIPWDIDVNEIPSGEPPKREIAGEWYEEWKNCRREVAMSVDELDV